MNIKAKVRILSYLAFFIIFLIVWTILHSAFENLENAYKGMISAAVSAILAPRINHFTTQSGKQMQLKWIFLKKPISL